MNEQDLIRHYCEKTRMWKLDLEEPRGIATEDEVEIILTQIQFHGHFFDLP